VAGYAAGGRNGSGPEDAVDKFDFSNDSRTTLATGLSFGRTYSAGFASSVAGYVAGGYNSSGVNVDTVDKFAFTDDSRSTLGTGLSSARDGAAGFAS
jgi:hypothetical protein